MSTTITFDSVSLQDANYTVRSARHDSSSERELDMLSIARDDGSILVAEKYTAKTILVTGIIKSATQAGLETQIDTLKELVSRREKNLDISYAGGTRRYVAYARNIRVERDHYHINYAPYEIEFVAPKGVGVDINTTASVNAQSADPTYTGTASFVGSARPKPVITLTFGANWVDAWGISFENTDTNEIMVVNRQTAVFASAKVLEIDCENKTVKYDSSTSNLNFYRVFPSFEIGSNNIQIKGGDIIDQQFLADATDVGFNYRTTSSTEPEIAQSFFVTNSDDTYQGISLRLGGGGGAGVLNAVIETDSGNAPSGVAVTNASFQINKAAIAAGNPTVFYLINSTNKFSLTANTRYWLVVAKPNSAASIYVAYAGIIGGDALYTTPDYPRGNAAIYSAGWVDYPNIDMFFKLHYGGKVDSPAGTLTLDVDYVKKYL